MKSQKFSKPREFNQPKISEEKLPDRGELVLCTVKKIMPHAAFVSLDEYTGLEAMLHISEISSKWIKNIKEHISENKKIVCKIMDVKGPRHIDVSLKRVTNSETKRKLEEIKTEQRIEKLLEFIAGKMKESSNSVEKIAEVMVTEFGSLADFYSYVKKEGVEVIDEIDIPKKWKDELKSQISEQLKSQFVKIKKEIKLSSFEKDGVVKIRKIFGEIKKSTKEEVSFSYLSSPRYSLEIKSRNYKEGNIVFDKLLKNMEKLCKKNSVQLGVIEDDK